MVFTIFAFVVLLGTVFPLIMEALDDRRTVVGVPYFDRLSLPIGIALLFLMAVAPVLPWRKASQELLRDRLFWPAWCGARLAWPAWPPGSPLGPRCASWRSPRGARADGPAGRLRNGGMIVHLGVIVRRRRGAASSAYARSSERHGCASRPL